MKPIDVKAIVKDVPYMTLTKGQYVYDFIVKNDLKNMLELGFCSGVSSTYYAGAAQDINGSLIAMDRVAAKTKQHNIENFLKLADLEKYVTIYYEPMSYTWRLMKFLQEGKAETFDFVYIDGTHTWDGAGFDFFLATKLLKKNGWVLFDDLLWSINGSPTHPNKDRYPEDYRSANQVGLVYELLVKTDNRYSNFFVPNEIKTWGFAQKIV